MFRHGHCSYSARIGPLIRDLNTALNMALVKTNLWLTRRAVRSHLHLQLLGTHRSTIPDLSPSTAVVPALFGLDPVTSNVLRGVLNID
jgi:hypothetical protein